MADQAGFQKHPHVFVCIKLFSSLRKIKNTVFRISKKDLHAEGEQNNLPTSTLMFDYLFVFLLQYFVETQILILMLTPFWSIQF